MPRKKAKKSRATKSTRQALYLSENMENEFRAIPNKLPTQFNKDIEGLKKQENKLQSSLLKMQKQEAAAKNKHAALISKSKNNLTSTAKKQINTAKKALETISAAALKLSSQLSDVKQHGKTLSQKQAKFSAICKYIASLDKEWERKNAKADKPKAKTAKSKPAKIAKPIAEETIRVILSKNEPVKTDMTPETVEAANSD